MYMTYPRYGVSLYDVSHDVVEPFVFPNLCVPFGLFHDLLGVHGNEDGARVVIHCLGAGAPVPEKFDVSDTLSIESCRTRTPRRKTVRCAKEESLRHVQNAQVQKVGKVLFETRSVHLLLPKK